MKVGDKIPVVLEIVKPVANGEIIITKDGPLELMNYRNDKFWASPSPDGPMYLVCDNGDTECGLIKRRAIVDLIESGVC